jgi:hypothetical protein
VFACHFFGFFNETATALDVITTITKITRMAASLPNSGVVGFGEGETVVLGVGVGVTDGLTVGVGVGVGELASGVEIGVATGVGVGLGDGLTAGALTITGVTVVFTAAPALSVT